MKPIILAVGLIVPLLFSDAVAGNCDYTTYEQISKPAPAHKPKHSGTPNGHAVHKAPVVKVDKIMRPIKVERECPNISVPPGHIPGLPPLAEPPWYYDGPNPVWPGKPNNPVPTHPVHPDHPLHPDQPQPNGPVNVPEPGSLALLAIAFLALGFARKRT